MTSEDAPTAGDDTSNAGAGADRGPADGQGGRDAGRAAVAAVVAVVVVAVAAAVVAPAVGRPANEIPVYDAVEGGDAFAEPTADAWDSAPPVTVALASAPSGVPNADATTVTRVSVRAARTDDRLFVRLSWADPTRDERTGAPREFADAAAVQLPVNTSARPPIAMGSTRNPVNVWYWRANASAEELLAGGPGTTTRFAQPAVETSTRYADGRWHVVFARDLTAQGANRTAITLTRDVDVALAVWNGSNMERSGRKAVSEWHHFALGPGPQGPPYEVLLWAIAGVSIAVVVLVTASAVTRT